LSALAELRERLAEVTDLGRAAMVLSWDQETFMPSGGLEDRANQLATLRRLGHQRLVAPEVEDLQAGAEAETASLGHDSDDASLVRVTRRDYEQARRLPAELVAEIAWAGTMARPVWREARARSDWSLFADTLRRTVDLARRQAEALGYRERPFDALIDRSEPGLTTGQVQSLFVELRGAIVPLLADITARPSPAGARMLERPLAPERQLALAREVIHRLGYDLERGRQDLSAHPFCTSFGPGDVRLTTRLGPTLGRSCLLASIHESGHALYNQGIPRSLDRTPLWGGASPGVHESQSRLWENVVGRSRAFCAHLAPALRETFGDSLGDLDAGALYEALNTVRPSYIRVDADELTYNLHIMIRTEIEIALMEDELRVEDVPDAWNERVRTYLGLPAPPASEGPLQDIHWTFPVLGAFVGYTLGNLIGAQLMERIRTELPDLDAQVAEGSFGALLHWLREHVHAHGRKFTPNELVERVCGSPIAAGPWIAYATSKFRDLYELR
jgi:carboxypeptidase Taq